MPFAIGAMHLKYLTLFKYSTYFRPKEKPMLIAVMSDSHDNIWNLRKAVEIIKDRQAGLLIHCGDFIAPYLRSFIPNSAFPIPNSNTSDI
jgi:hypothetical protein